MARGKPGWDWVPCASYATTEAVPAIPELPLGIVLVTPQGGTNFEGDPNVGTPDETDQITVHRIVGQVQVIGVALPLPVIVVLRIVVGLLDPESQGAFYADNYVGAGAAVDANEPFLWQRVITIQEADDTLDTIVDPMWSHVDVRAKRTLSQDQALFLTAQRTSNGGEEQLVVQPWLRSLVKVK